MLFQYQSYVSVSDSKEENTIYRPEVNVILMGSNGAVECQALVDTGADNTIFPRSFCDELGIDASPVKMMAKGFGGNDLQLYSGKVLLALQGDGDACHWTTNVMFFDFADPNDETVVLGNAGFLDYFTATFDGLNKNLSLVPNANLPIKEN